MREFPQETRFIDTELFFSWKDFQLCHVVIFHKSLSIRIQTTADYEAFSDNLLSAPLL